ncbi:hypothetical protein MUP51_01160 [Candidatus Bathyarchaeota archaeon]|nr:hypothetical protein [Candidatus Bathyarchaeota archaeon]
MKKEPQKEPERPNADSICGRLSFYNDNKMTHAVLLATVLFGQLQIKDNFLSPNPLWSITRSSLLYSLLYFLLVAGGIYEYKNFRVYSKMATEMNNILNAQYLLDYSDVSKLQSPYQKMIRGKLKDDKVPIVVYLALSILVFCLG